MNNQETSPRSGSSVTFTGTVVRFESDGFGIIEFDHPIGPSANSFGVISGSTGTVVSPAMPPNQNLHAGLRVAGTAEADESDVAAIKTITIGTGT